MRLIRLLVILAAAGCGDGPAEVVAPSPEPPRLVGGRRFSVGSSAVEFAEGADEDASSVTIPSETPSIAIGCEPHPHPTPVAAEPPIRTF